MISDAEDKVFQHTIPRVIVYKAREVIILFYTPLGKVAAG